MPTPPLPMPATPSMPLLSECLPPAQLPPAHAESPHPRTGKSNNFVRESFVRVCVRVCACSGGGGGVVADIVAADIVAVECEQHV